jgi:hypothetical protein
MIYFSLPFKTNSGTNKQAFQKDHDYDKNRNLAIDVNKDLSVLAEQEVNSDGVIGYK